VSTNGGRPTDAPGFDAIAAAAELDEAMADERAEGGAGDRYTRMLEQEIESLNALVADKEKQRAHAAEEARRAQAEIDNARMRLERDARRDAEVRFREALLGFLDVLDNLDRAIAAAARTSEIGPLLEGVKLVRTQMLARLGEHGVAPIAARGEAFDPNLHEAMSAVAAKDAADHGRVVDVLREGYAIGGEVLRPAGVVVAMKR
jgi:molecular chaperone GrpE